MSWLPVGFLEPSLERLACRHEENALLGLFHRVHFQFFHQKVDAALLMLSFHLKINKIVRIMEKQIEHIKVQVKCK